MRKPKVTSFSQASVVNYLYAPGTNISRLRPIMRRCGVAPRTKANKRFTREEAKRIIETTWAMRGRRMMRKHEKTEKQLEFFRSSHARRDGKSRCIGAQVSEEMRRIREEAAELGAQYPDLLADHDADASSARCETTSGICDTEESLTDQELFYQFHAVRRWK